MSRNAASFPHFRKGQKNPPHFRKKKPDRYLTLKPNMSMTDKAFSSWKQQLKGKAPEDLQKADPQSLLNIPS